MECCERACAGLRQIRAEHSRIAQFVEHGFLHRFAKPIVTDLERQRTGRAHCNDQKGWDGSERNEESVGIEKCFPTDIQRDEAPSSSPDIPELVDHSQESHHPWKECLDYWTDSGDE